MTTETKGRLTVERKEEEGFERIEQFSPEIQEGARRLIQRQGASPRTARALAILVAELEFLWSDTKERLALAERVKTAAQSDFVRMRDERDALRERVKQLEKDVRDWAASNRHEEAVALLRRVNSILELLPNALAASVRAYLGEE
jgi:cell division protein FtsB